MCLLQTRIPPFTPKSYPQKPHWTWGGGGGGGEEEEEDRVGSYHVKGARTTMTRAAGKFNNVFAAPGDKGFMRGRIIRGFFRRS